MDGVVAGCRAEVPGATLLGRSGGIKRPVARRIAVPHRQVCRCERCGRELAQGQAMATFKGEAHDAEAGESLVGPVRQYGIVENGLDGVAGFICFSHEPIFGSEARSAHEAIASTPSAQATGCSL